MTTNIETYFTDGCGRCPLGGTPGCKVHTWASELKFLRKIANECGLTEEVKWGVPCYTFDGANVVTVAAFKEYCALSFFKGSLLQDAEKLLEKPGENSQATRLIKFTDAEFIRKMEASLKAYIFEAIQVEKDGLTVTFKKETEPIPVELQEKLDQDSALKNAWEALTNGRKRSYIIHISQAKQAATRLSRAEKCIPKIFQGKGFLEY